jgi:hypothetical protein
MIVTIGNVFLLGLMCKIEDMRDIRQHIIYMPTITWPNN